MGSDGAPGPEPMDLTDDAQGKRKADDAAPQTPAKDRSRLSTMDVFGDDMELPSLKKKPKTPKKEAAQLPVKKEKATPAKATPAKKKRADGGGDDDTPKKKQAVKKEKATPVKKEKATAVKKEKATPVKKEKATPAKKKRPTDDDDDDDADDDDGDDLPFSKTKKKAKTPAKKTPAKKRAADDDDDDDDDDDLPLSKMKKKVKTPAKETPAKKTPAKKTPAKKAPAKKDDDNDDDDDDDDEDDEEEIELDSDPLATGTKTHWKTLHHNGVIFPPEYTPHNIPIRYKGETVHLPPAAEEVATMYANMLDNQYTKKEQFNKNFMTDWIEILKRFPETKKIKLLKHCDFSAIYEHLQAEKERKKKLTKDEKLAIKKEKDEREKKYTHCTMDGRQEKLGNFRIEPPGLFQGRGEHPKMGKLKKRIVPEEVTINISEDAPVPECPPGHKWKEVVHKPDVTWLAYWIENIQGNYKYVWLAASSSVRQGSDLRKFELARELKKRIAHIRKTYTKELKDDDIKIRQRATALYLIDVLALRVGNEKDTDAEADTVGCCSLRAEHVTCKPDNVVRLDFLGKDSMRYENEVAVTAAVYKNIKEFIKGKKGDEDLFDTLTTSALNTYLKNFMPKLTAKVFRTFNASWTLQEQLDKRNDTELSVTEKGRAYNDANRMVAILCNHKRTVSKTHHVAMKKANDHIADLERVSTVLQKIISLHEKEKPVSDAIYAQVETKEAKERRLKKEAKEAEEAAEEAKKTGKPVEPPATGGDDDDDDEDDFKPGKRKGRDEPAKSAKKQKGAKGKAVNKDEDDDDKAPKKKPRKVGYNRKFTLEQAKKEIERNKKRIQEAKFKRDEREDNCEISLSTSKLNYLDPRISIAWAKKMDFPVERVFNKSLRDKFPWAMKVDADWRF